MQRITLVERLIQLHDALDSADLDELKELREYVHRAQDNAIGWFEDRRGIVALSAFRLPDIQAHNEVRYIAKAGAELVLGLIRGDKELQQS